MKVFQLEQLCSNLVLNEVSEMFLEFLDEE